jgi:hypothetical protein
MLTNGSCRRNDADNDEDDDDDEEESEEEDGDASLGEDRDDGAACCSVPFDTVRDSIPSPPPSSSCAPLTSAKGISSSRQTISTAAGSIARRLLTSSTVLASVAILSPIARGPRLVWLIWSPCRGTAAAVAAPAGAKPLASASSMIVPFGWFPERDGGEADEDDVERRQRVPLLVGRSGCIIGRRRQQERRAGWLRGIIRNGGPEDEASSCCRGMRFVAPDAPPPA